MISFLIDNVFWVLLATASATGFIWTFLKGQGAFLSPQAAVLAVSREGGIFIDIRPEKDFMAGHIARARHVAEDNLESCKSLVAKFSQKPIVVVCQNGMRCKVAEQTLNKIGFMNTRILSGGIAAWREANFPLITEKKVSKNK